MDRNECELLPTTVSSVTMVGERPCPCYITLTFRTPGPLEYIVFQNHYTASISIKQKQNELWRTILHDFKLTQWPHFENDSQNWCIIPSHFFNTNYDPSSLTEFRIYLTQPSPNWKEFSLKNISCYTILQKPKKLSRESRTPFAEFKAKIQEKLDVLNSTSGTEMLTYDETLIGISEVNRLEATQM
ncbi:unnamed protein product [Blepharisma stoltei]|uniref:Uncharacterized protein n=1 Tax=Blepharisma stoltei TaxID=1481888 RepID=A0AAU9J7B5_9CILI|nr:unnamed protein product [Blepharisma stoltei]